MVEKPDTEHAEETRSTVDCYRVDHIIDSHCLHRLRDEQVDHPSASADHERERRNDDVATGCDRHEACKCTVRQPEHIDLTHPGVRDDEHGEASRCSTEHRDQPCVRRRAHVGGRAEAPR